MLIHARELDRYESFESAGRLIERYTEAKRSLWDREELPPAPPSSNIRIIETKPYKPKFDRWPELHELPPPVESENTGKGRIRYIVRAVTIVRRISASDLVSTGKHQWRVRARWLAWSIIKEITHQSYPGIGQAIPGREFDHTTVMYGIIGLADLINSGTVQGDLLACDRREIYDMAAHDIVKAGLKLPEVYGPHLPK